ncbi:MAG TPA: hypothetical protein PKE03_08255 [Bacteroidales bacterium]|mgnify:CR=1 FL=1|nr:hypothetical protein [Bacteroidales bacterium]
MKTRLFFLLMLLALVCACKKVPQAEYDPANLHLGFWSHAVVNDSVWTFTRVNKLPLDDYGFVLVRNGLFVERKNAGFCGTPPITYAEYEGQWEKSGDIMTIQTRYWGGSQEYIWKIKHIDEQKFAVIKMR